MQILIVNLDDRDVEFCPQPVLQALNEMPLVLERVRIVEPKLERDDADRRHYILYKSFLRHPFGGEAFQHIAFLDVVEKLARETPHSKLAFTSLAHRS